MLRQIRRIIPFRSDAFDQVEPGSRRAPDFDVRSTKSQLGSKGPDFHLTLNLENVQAVGLKITTQNGDVGLRIFNAQANIAALKMSPLNRKISRRLHTNASTAIFEGYVRSIGIKKHSG